MSVSGDDVVIFVSRKDAKAAQAAVLAKTSRNHHTDSELGQIVKQANITELDEMAFCSKWFYVCNGKLQATRDYKKTLNTRQYYKRNNAMFFERPELHRLAILEALESEQGS